MENEEEETIVEPENGTINQRDAHPKEESATVPSIHIRRQRPRGRHTPTHT